MKRSFLKRFEFRAKARRASARAAKRPVPVALTGEALAQVRDRLETVKTKPPIKGPHERARLLKTVALRLAARHGLLSEPQQALGVLYAVLAVRELDHARRREARATRKPRAALDETIAAIALRRLDKRYKII